MSLYPSNMNQENQEIVRSVVTSKILGSLGETLSGLLSIVLEGNAKLGVDQIILL
jgi:hypothetical protein